MSGRVQGVSFRFYSHEKANQLGLTGWVRNLDDGRVEMLIAGEPDSIETMVKWAHRGPPGAQVENVEVASVNEKIPKEPFFIRRDGGK